MRFSKWLASSLVLVSCKTTEPTSPGFSPLIGGEKVTSGYEFVVFGKSLGCTGVRVSARHVLTAAHCWTAPGNGFKYYAQSDFKEYPGDPDAPEMAPVRTAKIVNRTDAPGITTPAGSNKSVYKSNEPDFTVYELDGLADEVKIAPIDLTPVTGGTTVITLGHGCTAATNILPSFLHKLSRTVLVSSDAPAKEGDQEYLYYFFTESSSQAGGCEGDSGGPVMLNGSVVGINAFLSKNALSLEPTHQGYSRVSVADTAWWSALGIATTGTAKPPSSEKTDTGENPNNTPTSGSGGSGGTGGSGGSGGCADCGSGGTATGGTGGTGGSAWCYCDDQCQSNGDCCADCGSGGDASGGTGGSQCYCDADCAEYGDCCSNCP